MKNLFVADIMTREPIVTKPTTNLLECAKMMVKKRVGSLLLVQDKKLVGFISQKDILWALIKKSRADLSKIKAIDISPKKLATIRPFASVKSAIEKMKKVKFDRLPVIQKGELVGVLTRKDILNFNPEVYPELDEFEIVREETEKLNRLKTVGSRVLIEKGICEECGAHSSLYRFNGLLVCGSCMDSL
jgi:CBS domain-containing protein